MATKAEWEHHRPLITNLYVDQRMKLDEIMTIMLQHGHLASKRTYKNYFRRWGIEKKLKERDVVAIVRKKNLRDAMGKRSSFRVRGQLVTMDQVDAYFKRKREILDVNMINAPTPPDVSCSTPSPSPSPRPFDDSAPFPAVKNHLGTVGPRNLPPSSSFTHEMICGLMQRTPTPHKQFQIDERILQETIKDIYSILAENPQTPRSPSPPQCLVELERLFFYIRRGYESSIESGFWVLDATGFYITVDQRQNGIQSYPADLFEDCMNAVARLDRQDYVGARRLLAKLSDCVHDQLQNWSPKTLIYLLMSFLHLIEHEYYDICRSLRNFVGTLAAESPVKIYPWNQICQILCTFDEDSLKESGVRAVECAANSFIELTGSLNMDTLIAQVRFIEMEYGKSDPLEHERRLRELLLYCEAGTNAASDQSLYIMYSLACLLFIQGRPDEAEMVALDLLLRSEETGSIWPKTSAKHMLAVRYFYQNKKDAAESSMLDVIKLNLDEWGESDPSTIRLQLILEGWLREWGREEEANILAAKIEEAIGPDMTDLEAAAEAENQNQN